MTFAPWWRFVQSHQTNRIRNRWSSPFIFVWVFCFFGFDRRLETGHFEQMFRTNVPEICRVIWLFFCNLIASLRCSQIMISSGIVLKLFRVLPTSQQSILKSFERLLTRGNESTFGYRLEERRWWLLTQFSNNTKCSFFRCFVFSDAEAKTNWPVETSPIKGCYLMFC